MPETSVPIQLVTWCRLELSLSDRPVERAHPTESSNASANTIVE